jgi:2-polyprenyl-6-methoxyphenol hydroxylase-like FAD-dependent oxidoreductase
MDQPKAHVFDPRTLEIYRQLGIGLEAPRAAGMPPQEAEVVRFAGSMTGLEFGVIDRIQYVDRQSSPEAMFNVAQPFLEDHLLNIARTSYSDKIAYFRQSEWQSAATGTDGIVSQILCRKTQSLHTITSKYR